MRTLGSRQLLLLRLCGKLAPCRSGDLWEAMRWSKSISETEVSRMLCRLEDLGLVDDQNALTQAGRAMLDERGWFGRGCPPPEERTEMPATLNLQAVHPAIQLHMVVEGCDRFDRDAVREALDIPMIGMVAVEFAGHRIIVTTTLPREQADGLFSTIKTAVEDVLRKSSEE